jgi:uncharacterized membrane protein YdjX (TVP38/TMEM64 family)
LQGVSNFRKITIDDLGQAIIYLMTLLKGKILIKGKILKKIDGIRKDFGKIGFFAVLAMVMPIIGLSVFLGLIYQISPWLEANQTISVPAFIFTISILSGLAILPTNIVGMTSGWAFGFPLGLLTMLSAIGGAVAINFFISRKLAGKHFERVIKEKPKLKVIHQALLEGSLLKVVIIIVLLRLSPATPFAATNFLISASGVSMKSYIVGTVLGYLPRTSATVFVGSSLTKLNFEQPSESWLIIWGIIATVIATVVIGILSKRALNRLTLEQI